MHGQQNIKICFCNLRLHFVYRKSFILLLPCAGFTSEHQHTASVISQLLFSNKLPMSHTGIRLFSTYHSIQYPPPPKALHHIIRKLESPSGTRLH